MSKHRLKLGYVNLFKKRDYFDDVQPSLHSVGMGLCRESAVGHQEERAVNGNSLGIAE